MKIKLSRFFSSYYTKLMAKKPTQQISNSKIVKVSKPIANKESMSKKIIFNIVVAVSFLGIVTPQAANAQNAPDIKIDVEEPEIEQIEEIIEDKSLPSDVVEVFEDRTPTEIFEFSQRIKSDSRCSKKAVKKSLAVM